MPRKVILLLVLIATAALIGCAAAPSPSRSESSAPQESGGARPAAPAPSTGTSSSQSAVDRMVVRNATLRLVVENVDEVLSKVAQLTRNIGGFVVSSESRDNNGNRLGKVTLRVPADRLDESLNQLKGMAVRVAYENITAKDVTEEYVDQDARLKTLRAQEDQYLKLLEKTTTTEDIIKVTQALTQVRGQIESTEGRLQYLRRSSEMALITLDLSTPATAQSVSTGEWNAMETLYSAVHGLLDALLILASLAIWIVVFVPIWLPFVLLIRWWRRRRRRATPPVPPAAPVSGTT